MYRVAKNAASNVTWELAAPFAFGIRIFFFKTSNGFKRRTKPISDE